MSQRRSAARAAAERELLRSLLRHGARFLSPEVGLLEEAEKLAQLGLVELQRLRTVRCANPLDVDFSPTSHCDGLIDLRPDADEGGGQYRCSRCERIVYPEADRKQAFDSVVVHLHQAGIEAFLIDRCRDLASGRAFADGVLTVPIRGINAFVCLIDYCDDDPWRRHSTAVGQPAVYVTVDADRAAGILDDEAIARVALADILLGTKDLRAALIDRATKRPALASNIDVSIYTLGARPISLEPQGRAEPRRIFHLSLSSAGLLVDGLLAIRTGRTTAMAIMQVFMQRFIAAAMSGGSVEPMTADALANGVEPFIGSVDDPDTVARHIPRIRKSVTDAVRQHTGKPIGEHDVIETVSRSGVDEDADGYRLNPRSVALGPLEP